MLTTDWKNTVYQVVRPNQTEKSLLWYYIYLKRNGARHNINGVHASVQMFNKLPAFSIIIIITLLEILDEEVNNNQNNSN